MKECYSVFRSNCSEKGQELRIGWTHYSVMNNVLLNESIQDKPPTVNYKECIERLVVMLMIFCYGTELESCRV